MVCRFSNQSHREVFPFSLLTINYTEFSSNYLYIAGSGVEEKDGLYRDKSLGKIFRINRNTKEYELCLDINSDYFHGFDAVTDNYLVYRYEDHTPDNMTEIIIMDLKSKKTASIFDFWGTETEYNYEFIKNKIGEIQYVLIKRWIKEDIRSSNSNELKCFCWNEFIEQLNWTDISV